MLLGVVESDDGHDRGCREGPQHNDRGGTVKVEVAVVRCNWLLFVEWPGQAEAVWRRMMLSQPFCRRACVVGCFASATLSSEGRGLLLGLGLLTLRDSRGVA